MYSGATRYGISFRSLRMKMMAMGEVGAAAAAAAEVVAVAAVAVAVEAIHGRPDQLLNLRKIIHGRRSQANQSRRALIGMASSMPRLLYMRCGNAPGRSSEAVTAICFRGP